MHMSNKAEGFKREDQAYYISFGEALNFFFRKKAIDLKLVGPVFFKFYINKINLMNCTVNSSFVFPFLE